MRFHKRNSLAAKLVAEQVVEIRRKYATGEHTQGGLAREYKISVVQIGRILRGESWQGLPTEPTQEEIDRSMTSVLERLKKEPTTLDGAMQEEAQENAARDEGLQDRLGKKTETALAATRKYNEAAKEIDDFMEKE